MDISNNKNPTSLPNEKWKGISGFPNYIVSSLGRVKSIHSGRILSQESLRDGYLRVHLSRDGKAYHLLVHRLVAMSFIPNPECKPTVNHVDCNPKNNNVINLDWMTQKEQVNWRDRTSKMIGNPNYRKSRKLLSKHLSKPFYLVDVNTGLGFVTLSARGASVLAKCNRSSISRLGTGRDKTIHGYKGMYISKDFEIITKDMQFTKQQKKILLDSSVAEIILE